MKSSLKLLLLVILPGVIRPGYGSLVTNGGFEPGT